MIEWIIVGLAAGILEGVGYFLGHTGYEPNDSWPTTLTWLIVRTERHHRWLSVPLFAFWLWLGYHFFIQHRVVI